MPPSPLSVDNADARYICRYFQRHPGEPANPNGVWLTDLQAWATNQSPEIQRLVAQIAISQDPSIPAMLLHKLIPAE